MCETVCVISSGASLEEEVDHVRVYDIHVYGCIYMHIHAYGHEYTCIRLYIHAYTKMMSICTYIHVYVCIHTCQLIDKRRTHSHSHKSVGIPKVHVINPVCHDQIFANTPESPRTLSSCTRPASLSRRRRTASPTSMTIGHKQASSACKSECEME